ncbi:hypothetical protein Trydic_g1522 [Trypoxylus dichotomus]
MEAELKSERERRRRRKGGWLELRSKGGEEMRAKKIAEEELWAHHSGVLSADLSILSTRFTPANRFEFVFARSALIYTMKTNARLSVCARPIRLYENWNTFYPDHVFPSPTQSKWMLYGSDLFSLSASRKPE